MRIVLGSLLKVLADELKTGTLEMLLLLLWRHLAYYADQQHLADSKLKTSTAHAMRFLSIPEPDTFRAEVGKKLAHTLQQLASLDLVSYLSPDKTCMSLMNGQSVSQDYESLGSDWRTNQGYVEIMCRRLRDSVGLHDAVASLDGV